MKANLLEGEIRTGQIWVTFSGKVMIDGAIWYAEAEGDESLRGVSWTLKRQRTYNGITSTEEKRLGPGSDPVNAELEELLGEDLDSKGILGGEVLKYDPNEHESQILTVRVGRVVGGHNIPLVGSEADTFGPIWSR